MVGALSTSGLFHMWGLFSPIRQVSQGQDNASYHMFNIIHRMYEVAWSREKIKQYFLWNRRHLGFEYTGYI